MRRCLLVISWCLVSAFPSDIETDVVSSFESIRTGLEALEKIIWDKNQQISYFKQKLEKAEEKRTNCDEVVNRNDKLEKALESLKEILHESSQRIIAIESENEKCMKTNGLNKNTRKTS